MTIEEAIKLLSQIRDALLASNSWLPSTKNPIKESFGMAIEALTAGEKDLMGDVNRIRAEDISVIKRLPSAQLDLSGYSDKLWKAAYERGKAEAQPQRKKGKWIEEPNCYYRCSECGEHYPSILGYMNYNFCPNCGARMEGEG